MTRCSPFYEVYIITIIITSLYTRENINPIFDHKAADHRVEQSPGSVDPLSTFLTRTVACFALPAWYYFNLQFSLLSMYINTQ